MVSQIVFSVSTKALSTMSQKSETVAQKGLSSTAVRKVQPQNFYTRNGNNDGTLLREMCGVNFRFMQFSAW